MARDMGGVRAALTEELFATLQAQCDQLRAQRRINRLENIAVRRSEIRAAWVEAGRAFITIHFLANLLDYTLEEQTGRLVSGSRETPVKFEECWTFVRPAGGSPWQLTAIQQVR
jgi:predicted lipid-binding transport protein (Tim44 family)